MAERRFSDEGERHLQKNNIWKHLNVQHRGQREDRRCATQAGGGCKSNSHAAEVKHDEDDDDDDDDS